MQPARSHRKASRLKSATLYICLLSTSAFSQVAPNAAPAAFGVADRAVVMVAHGVGAQIYECKSDDRGHSVWTFREPIAALVRDGQTIGRHYAGPTWELTDGGAIGGKPAASQPGATDGDLPLLKLDVVTRRGGGALGEATLVLRLNTHGGVLKGPCEHGGDLRSEPYAADYLFLK